MAPNIFRFLLVAVAIYAWLRGGREERAAATLCVVAAIATTLLLSPFNERYQQPEYSVILVDVSLCVGFTAIALRSSRFWPLWVAGLQLTTILGHLLKGIESELMPRAYAAALNFWAYPIILILAVGTWRAHQRAERETERKANPA